MFIPELRPPDTPSHIMAKMPRMHLPWEIYKSDLYHGQGRYRFMERMFHTPRANRSEALDQGTQ